MSLNNASNTTLSSSQASSTPGLSDRTTPRPSAGDPNIKALLFDLDDTLWPIEPVIVRAENLLHEWLQLHVPEVASTWSIESLRQRRERLKQENPHFQIDFWALRHAGLTEAFIACGAEVSMVEQAMAFFAAARNEVTPFADVKPALERLGKHFRIGSISNGFADLKTIGLANLFEFSVAAYRFGRAKPDPAIFHHACEALSVHPSQAIYVGDDLLLDVEGAQKAGLRGVWINRFARSAPAAVRPNAICHDLFELESWLNIAISSE